MVAVLKEVHVFNKTQIALISVTAAKSVYSIKSTSQTSMDKQKKMIILCLLLEAISSPVFSAEWEAQVVKDLEALATSCVVIPCSFKYPGKKVAGTKLRAIWYLHNDKNETVFHEDDSMIVPKFRGRTKLVGRLGDGNCSLEMIEVEEHDIDSFCLRIEIPGTGDYSFVQNCARLSVRHDAPKPKLTYLETALPGNPYTITCSVTHTCPSYMPKLTWSMSSQYEIIEHHKNNGHGSWETQSILTIVPEEKDDHAEITCSATFTGKQISSQTFRLFVKRKENHRHIIVPIAVAVGTAVVFGVVCVFMMKKYKRRIAELQSSRNGSMWNRLSRLSRRIRPGGSGPARVEQRPNNVSSTMSSNQKFSKARFPSPKSQPRSKIQYPRKYSEDSDDEPDYTNTADLNIYGNL